MKEDKGVPFRRAAMARCLVPYLRLQAVGFTLLCLLLGPGTQHQAHAACTLPASLQGKWYQVDTGTDITMTSTTTSGQDIRHGSTSTYAGAFNCFASSQDQYVFVTDTTVKDPGDRSVNGYFCWKLVQASDVAFLLYQLTAEATSGAFNGEKILEVVATATQPSLSNVCSVNFASTVPTLLYKYSGSSLADVATAEQLCSSELFANYSYVKDGMDCSGTSSDLSFCKDRQTARIDYTACATKILYSQDGVLSCVAHTTVQSAVYQILYNQDSAPDDTNYFRFVCLKVTKSGNVETATVYPKDCASGTNHNLALTRTMSCPIVDDGGGDDDNTLTIVGTVIGSLAFVAIGIVVIILLYKLVFKKRSKAMVLPAKPVPNGISVHTNAEAGRINTNEAPPPEAGENAPNFTENNNARRGSRLPPLNDTMPRSEPLRL